MSNKAKKAKQAQLRKREQTKALNRIRGMVKNPNLTDTEASFYKEALASKETPYEFLVSHIDNVTNLLKEFSLIEDVAGSEEMMPLIEQGWSIHHQTIKNAGDYLAGVAKEIKEVADEYTEPFKQLGNSYQDVLQIGPALEKLANIQDELANNAVNLMGAMETVITIYAELSQQVEATGAANDNH